MAHVTFEKLNGEWNLVFVVDHVQSVRDRVQSVRKALQEWSRRRREFRAIEAELRQYSRDQITELGISRADISHIANEATQHRREEEFRSALGNYIADYKKHRAVSEVNMIV